MNDFRQHRAALAQAWADTNPDNFPETEIMDFSETSEPNIAPDVNHSPLDDLWSDITWVTVLMYAFAILYLTFGA